MMAPSNHTFETIPLPALVGILGRSYEAVRSLNPDDQEDLRQARTLYHCLKPTMTMFQIVN